VTLREGDGVGGSDRITMVWDDGAVKNGWLQVTVRAERLGLAEDDVFYFGNAVGETGNSAADARVSVADLLLARNNPRGLLDPAEIDCPYDFNRDRRVNATDVLLARNHQTGFADALRLIGGRALGMAGGVLRRPGAEDAGEDARSGRLRVGRAVGWGRGVVGRGERGTGTEPGTPFRDFHAICGSEPVPFLHSPPGGPIRPTPATCSPRGSGS